MNMPLSAENHMDLRDVCDTGGVDEQCRPQPTEHAWVVSGD